jgi:hypothetical protein
MFSRALAFLHICPCRRLLAASSAVFHLASPELVWSPSPRHGSHFPVHRPAPSKPVFITFFLLGAPHFHSSPSLAYTSAHASASISSLSSLHGTSPGRSDAAYPLIGCVVERPGQALCMQTVDCSQATWKSTFPNESGCVCACTHHEVTFSSFSLLYLLINKPNYQTNCILMFLTFLQTKLDRHCYIIFL